MLVLFIIVCLLLVVPPTGSVEIHDCMVPEGTNIDEVFAVINIADRIS